MMHRFCEALEGRRLLALTPAGGEFRANTTTVGDQFAPSVAADSSGTFIVVWVGNDASDTGIFAQRYNSSGVAQGSEFPVNTVTSGTQAQPTVAMDASGNFVIAWTNNGDIVARRFNSSGTALDVTEFTVNTFPTGQQESPSIAIRPSTGDFVIAWDDDTQDGSSFGVFARRYNSAGVAQDVNEFQVNQFTTDLQADPSVGMDGSGNFVVAWDSGNLTTGQDGSLYGVYARRYNAAGVAQGNEFQVNSYTTDYQIFPSVGMNSSGNFVIAWQSYQQEGVGLGYGIFARRYDSTGTALGSEFLVNSITAGSQTDAAVSLSASDAFTITWTGTFQDGSGQYVAARGFDSSGNAVGLDKQINSTMANDQSRPAIAPLPNGYAMIAWQDGSPTPGVNGQDGSGYGVFAQRLGPARVTAAYYSVNANALLITFSENVAANFTPADLLFQQIVNSVPVTIPSSNMFLASYDASTNTAKIDFSAGYANGILPDGNYRITVQGAGIFDFAGNAVDADNNGVAGGDLPFDFFILAGDANRDRIVNNADLGIMAMNWLGSPRTYTQADFNYDGRVDIKDLRTLAVSWLHTLPAPGPALSPEPASTSLLTARRTATRVITLI